MSPARAGSPHCLSAHDRSYSGWPFLPTARTLGPRCNVLLRSTWHPMKQFELSRDMLNLRGQFYPTGHIVAMFPSADSAQRAARALVDAGLDPDGTSLITPEAMLQDIAHTIGSSGATLPSPGSEADTVRRYAEYAAKGHYGLLVKAPDAEDSDRVMEVLQRHEVAHAQKYRMLVIEDLA